jgi:hypothetical protein
MEYSLLYVQQPSAGFSMQLGRDVSQFLRFHPEQSGGRHPSNRHLAFLSRVPGILRVLPEALSPWFVALEDERRRLVARALVSPSHLFCFPLKAVEQLGIGTHPHLESGIRSTEDTFVWFVPAPEYYEFKAALRRPKGWTGPSPGGFPHVYVARGVVPFRSELPELDRTERHVEEGELRPRLEALERVARAAR